MQGQSNPRAIVNRYAAINYRLFCLHAGLALWMLFGAAAAHRIAGWPWEWTVLLPALLANGYWAVLHEALHGNLDADYRRNRGKGRALAILFGSSFRVLRFGHLSHHRFNRHPLDRPDAYDPRRTTRYVAYLRFLGHTLGGQYLGEILLPLLFWLPEKMVREVLGRVLKGDDERLGLLRQQAMATLGNARAVNEIRVDSALALAILTASAALWGDAWPWLVAALAFRALLVSFVDNLYHFRTPIDRPDFAMNLQLPRPLRALILNTNMHQVHHRAMTLPWWQLPERFSADRDCYDDRFFAVALAQLRGPLPIEQLRAGK